MDTRFRYAYLHGFASSPLSRKGVHLRDRLAEKGVELWLPDLNCPSFAKLSHAAMLAHLDQVDAMTPDGRPWRFIGSSLGGWVAARWAQLRQTRVDRLLLLCPGFGLAERWPELLGAEAIATWEREGALPLPDGSGTPVPIHYGFLEEARTESAAPGVACPTVIIHGSRDEVVPIESSRRYSLHRRNVRLVEVDDDHTLMQSLDAIEMEALRHFA
ncbi:MAG: YqiA/YcfP family alpha/beta fold hydrolase [Myxococcota bacterium]